jgi:diguanylate cyclase (GGDEF)-like protein/PAS domain S-box-containing protein
MARISNLETDSKQSSATGVMARGSGAGELRRYREAVDELGGGIFELRRDREGESTLYLSHGARRLIGVGSRGPVFLSHIQRRLHASDAERLFYVAESALEKRIRRVDTEVRVEHHGQVARWVWVTGKVIDHRDALSLIGCVWDITDRKSADPQFHEAYEAAGLGHWQWNVKSDQITGSRQFFRAFGIEGARGSVSMETLLNAVYFHDRRGFLEAMRKTLLLKQPMSVEFRIYRLDGRLRYLQAQGGARVGADGEPDMVVGTVQDVSRRMEEVDGLKLAQEILNSSMDGVILTDADGTIVMVNPAFTQITGYSFDEAVGKTPRLLRSDHHDRDFYRSMWKQIKNEGRWQGEIWNRRKNGEAYPQWLSISEIRDPTDAGSKYVAIFHDISEIKADQALLEYRAYHDPLTDLPNRTLFQDRLDRAVEYAHRSRRMVGVIFLDLDNFKAVNDTLGHQAGDELLRIVAQRLSTCVRKMDTVARAGGDEFTFIVEDLASQSDISRIVRAILSVLARPMKVGDSDITVQGSIGIAMCPQDADSPDGLLRASDEAMYLAKQRGKARSAFASELRGTTG